MKLENTITEMVLGADAKALATMSQGDINVVPVSTVKVVDDAVILVNYFMGKTLENIQDNPEVALVCWKGLGGYQIKGTVDYETDGERFIAIKNWVSEILPERIVKGILVLHPREIFDISATAEKPGSRIM